ncbi:hypothetical protein T459_04145 [Capsicum annuum]|uniref:Uncharacterized protein n=1 Tax=Capsicum annuum TaxID=4072 RepID=A0A2G3A478_CAPAN|nr:hypothetical protein T459_04145 [Capsicum annuum]
MVHGVMVPRCLGGMVPWHHGTMVPWLFGALVPWCLGTVVRSATVCGTLVPWCHSARCRGAMVPSYFGAMVPWFHDAMVHGATNSTKTQPWISLVRTSSELAVQRARKGHDGTVPNSSLGQPAVTLSHCWPPPEFPMTSPHSGIILHLLGPDRYAHTRTLLRRSRSVTGAPLRGIPPISFLMYYGFTRPLNHTHVRLLGLCYKTGRMGITQASVRSAQMPSTSEACAACHNRGDGVPRAYQDPGLWPPPPPSPIHIGPFPSRSED